MKFHYNAAEQIWANQSSIKCTVVNVVNGLKMHCIGSGACEHEAHWNLCFEVKPN